MLRHPSAVLLWCFVLSLPLSPPASAVPGDTSLDGQVSVGDAVPVLGVAAGFWSANPILRVTGDVVPGPGNTWDGTLTVADAVQILRAASGQVDLGAQPAWREAVTISSDAVHDIRLGPGFRVNGTVYDQANQPTGRTPIFYEAPDGPSAPSQPTGNTYVAALAPGAYRAYARLLGKYPAEPALTATFFLPISETVTVDRDMVVDCHYPGYPALGRLTGTIEIEADGLLGLQLRGETDAGDYAGSYTDLVMEPESTSYSLGVVPGAVSLGVSGSVRLPSGKVGGVSARFHPALPVSAGQTVPFNAKAGPWVVVTGAVSARSDLTPNSIRFEAKDDGGPGPFADAGGIVPGGTYELALIPGTYRVHVSLKSAAGTSFNYHTEVTVSASGGVVDIAMPDPPATVLVSGTVTDAVGKPGRGRVSLSPPASTDTLGITSAAGAEVDSTGRFSLRVLPGSYTLSFTPEIIPTP